MTIIFQAEDRQFSMLATIQIHDKNRKKHKVQLDCVFKELGLDRSKEITEEAAASILEESLISVKPVNFELVDKNQNPITDPDLTRESVLNNVTLAKGCMDAYWEETIKKKDL